MFGGGLRSPLSECERLTNEWNVSSAEHQSSPISLHQSHLLGYKLDRNIYHLHSFPGSFFKKVNFAVEYGLPGARFLDLVQPQAAAQRGSTGEKGHLT